MKWECKQDFERHFRQALAAGHIWPAFQPIVDLQSGRLSGFEILARWTDPAVGPIGPTVFVPQLERNRLINVLSDVMFTQACSEASQWAGDFYLAFNISPVQLTNRALPNHIAALIAHTNFPIARAQVEVTESCLLGCGLIS